MVEPTTDYGQELPVPEKKAIGFADSEVELQAITKALNRAGFPDSKITVMHGQDGIHLLERLRDVAFYGDWERSVIDAGISELEKGGYSIRVGVDDRDQAVEVFNIATPLGGHSFNYFGRLVNEQLTE